MREVKIYVETSLCGPGIRDGWYAVIMEYMTAKGPATCGFTGMERDTTYYRSVLLAMVRALKRLTESCDVKIYTRCSFIKNMVENGTLDNWKRSEWQKPDGEEIKNKELWQQFLDGAGKHRVEIRFSKHHGYRGKLQKMIEEEKNGAKSPKSP